MKLFTKVLFASALTVAVTAPAAAAVSPSLQQDVYRAAGSNSNVRVQVSGDTVTLSGYAEDSYAVLAVERAARSADGVGRVINNVFKTN